jgi:hypothetical protein
MGLGAALGRRGEAKGMNWERGHGCKIRVAVHGYLRSYALVGAQGSVVEVPEGARVDELLTYWGMCGGEVRRIEINGQPARSDSRVQRRDQLDLFP